MVKISRQRFEALLFGLDSCQFVGFTALTTPDMKKTLNPFFGTTVKISRVNGVVNWKYSSSVNKQLVREGKADAFKAFPRTWGQRINNCPLVCHINEDGVRLYVEVKVERRDVGYFDTETLERVPESALKKFLKPDSESRQGTEKTIVLRDYRLDHIAEMTIAKETYRVLPLWYEHAVYLPAPTPPAEPEKVSA